MIELAKTIRLAREDELPNNSDAQKRLQHSDNAKIFEGYTFQLKETGKEDCQELPFKFYSEINVNNSRLWDLVICLTGLLPDVSALLIGFSEAELNYCQYEATEDLIVKLQKYKTELIEDTFIEWGIIFNDEKTLTEIFISSSKYIKLWGVDIEGFQDIMKMFGLNQIDDLEFIDEYPNVKVPLRLFEDSIIDTTELINEIRRYFIW